MEMGFAIRRMAPEYASGRGYVHYAAWGETYCGLMDERFLAGHTLEKCTDYAKRNPYSGYVALVQGEVVGFASCLQNARAFVSVPGAAEIVALYVLRAYQGLGIGRALIERCLEELAGRDVVLFVLKGNDNAIGFYRKMGFAFTGKELAEELDGAKIVELEMARNASARGA